MIKLNDKARFYDKVDFTPTCWNWTGCTDAASKNGQFRYKRKTIPAHRFSLMIVGIETSPKVRLYRTCKNSMCVNPDHIIQWLPKNVLLSLRKIISNTGCWEWPYCSIKGGYGTVCFNRKNTLVHRLSYETFVDIIPPELCVLHKCDNPACYNPDHLFLGTLQNNNMDKMCKGREAKGSILSIPKLGIKNPNSKLSESDIKDIRASSKKQRELAVIYNVGQDQISRIISRKRWNHI